jgi:hypothetical protein
MYKAASYSSEADLEAAIVLVQKELFGPNRIYLDIKKKIGVKGGIRNIPDGYLIDLSGSTPRLYVVENELAAHDPLRHIAVQILQFSLSFESEQIGVKKILLDAISRDGNVRDRCENYARSNGYRNLDHLLEWLVFESPFSALVIIDEIPENLENILAKKFQFGVEVLHVSRYRSGTGEEVYHFEPFLADLGFEDSATDERYTAEPSVRASTDYDTLVVPAHEEGFKDVFLAENRWYSVRVHGSMRPQIKYIAAYQVAPVSAITYVAPVRSIEPWKDSQKWVINFAEPAKEIRPIPMLREGRVKGFMSPRYALRAQLDQARSLDDLW